LSIDYDATGRVWKLNQLVSAGVTRVTEFTYGTHAAGSFLSREYRILDAQGNILEQGESLAGAADVINVTRFQYANVYQSLNSAHRLISAANFTGTDIDGAGGAAPTGALTARYVYDDAGSAVSLVGDDGLAYANSAVNLDSDRSENHLRFSVSAEGRVTEYRYNALGQLTAQIDYTGTLYTGTVFTEKALFDWVNAAGTDKTAAQLNVTKYDFRGNVRLLVSYSRTTVDTQRAGFTCNPVNMVVAKA
jgi:YD repeat-containing protein